MEQIASQSCTCYHVSSCIFLQFALCIWRAALSGPWLPSVVFDSSRLLSAIGQHKLQPTPLHDYKRDTTWCLQSLSERRAALGVEGSGFGVCGLGNSI